jgi:hypothetical protein
LFQIGVCGIVFVLTYLINIFKDICYEFKVERDLDVKYKILAILSGCAGFLVAGATNPMVTSSWFWMIVFVTYNFSDEARKNFRYGIQ